METATVKVFVVEHLDESTSSLLLRKENVTSVGKKITLLNPTISFSCNPFNLVGVENPLMKRVASELSLIFDYNEAFCELRFLKQFKNLVIEFENKHTREGGSVAMALIIGMSGVDIREKSRDEFSLMKLNDARTLSEYHPGSWQRNKLTQMRKEDLLLLAKLKLSLFPEAKPALVTA